MIDICQFKDQYPDIECCRTPNNDVFILIGGLGREDPESYLRKASEYLMDGTPCSQYVEEYLDNPWTRVLITRLDGASMRHERPFCTFFANLGEKCYIYIVRCIYYARI